MNLQAGDLVLIRIEFPQAAGGKVRPAVVVLDDGDDDFVAVPVTSREGRRPHRPVRFPSELVMGWSNWVQVRHRGA